MSAIVAKGITKRFGKTVALQDVSFTVGEGDAVALVGPNGAGKTTLLRILATLSRADGGYAEVMGLDGRFRAAEIRRRIGYMPDGAGTYGDLTVKEYLEFFAGLHGLRRERTAATVRDLVDLLELGELRDRPTAELSRGMQQRVGLARTLMHDPPILLLDEPAANLDPLSRMQIREVLGELRRMGKTLLISSHILVDLDRICTRLLCLDRGRVLYSGSIEEVAGQIQPQREIALRIEGDGKKLGEVLEKEAGVESVSFRDEELQVRLHKSVEDYSFVLRSALEQRIIVRGLREVEPNLEEVFFRLTRRGEEE